ncbi:MAG: TonB-dependent receptor [Porticoccaceae bacterium]|jgi:iron complex outermembrane recepter protein|nr:TonB-dependent receptor [Alphaproteobacteria bacterium]MDP4744048.1 TonB-dependent receptor [Porticoccaceae bacterium]MDP5050888.1 TonB-dependent receptor [Porticoccaceae bacterium]
MKYPRLPLKTLSLAISASLCGSVFAQSSDLVFEEVLVTAEKRSESLQDLSQAITVLGGADLDNRQIASFIDLSAIAPGVNIAKNEGFKTVITIRGVGNEANQNAIANPSVSYHLDGIYVASPFALQTDFLDLERIEVLRGPQGTLFGQNSTGGAINVITTAPSIDSSFGKADLTLGDYGLVKARAAYNLPLTDTLAMRASVISNTRDGFTENLTLGQDLDDANSMSARIRVLYEPSDNFRANFTAQYFDEDRNGAAQKGLLDPTPDARELRQDSLAAYELTSELYSAVLEWDFESFTLKSLTSYQNDDVMIIRDNDRNDSAAISVFQIPSLYDPETNKQTTITQEVNLVSVDPLFGKLDWVAGLFYLDTEVEISILERLDFGLDGFDPITDADIASYGGDVGFISDSKPERDSTSVYGQGTWHFNEAWRAVFGLRYTEDEVYSEVTNFYGREGTDIIETSSEKVTGRLVVEHDFNESTMAYGAYTRGFKPGGSNLTYGREEVIAPIVVLPTFNEEIVDAYEVGLKTDLVDGRVRMNTAAFYYNYEGLQYQATDPEVFQGGVGNIPKSEIFGAELELSAFLSESLILDVRLAWLETEITADHLALDNVQSEAAGGTLIGGGAGLFSPEVQQARSSAVQNVNGNELAKTPKFTGNVALNWNTDIASWGELNSSLQYTYRGGFKHRIFNNDATDVVPSYNVIDLIIGLRPEGKDWRVELIGKNLSDEAGINARFTDVFGVGATGDELIGPRQFMARFSMDF